MGAASAHARALRSMGVASSSHLCAALPEPARHPPLLLTAGAEDCVLMIAARQVRAARSTLAAPPAPPLLRSPLRCPAALPTSLGGAATPRAAPGCPVHPQPLPPPPSPLTGAHPRGAPLRPLPACAQPPDHRALVRPALCALCPCLRRRRRRPARRGPGAGQRPVAPGPRLWLAAGHGVAALGRAAGGRAAARAGGRGV